MKRSNIFYLIFVLTILAIRLEVFLFPSNKIIVDGIRINHFWIGVILILLVLFLSKNYNIIKMVLLPIGLGIVADELFFMIFSNRTLADYWSIYSIIGVITTTVIIFVIREKLASKIYK
ncbi:MAG: hypothetical protein WC735_00060 [Candidatus Paceibacterota bacterium]|jgi:hypothetical protein